LVLKTPLLDKCFCEPVTEDRGTLQEKVLVSVIKVSIVIPTYNGGLLFQECLEAIYSQCVDFLFEVVVIDSGSTDGTVSIAKSFPVRLHEIDQKEFNHGLTRNKGIALSTGDFVVLLCQDAIPTNADWLKALVAPFLDDVLVAGVYTRQIPREDANVLTKRHLNRWLTGRTERDVKHITNWAEYENLPPLQKYMFCNFDDVCSCIRRTVWEKIPYEWAVFAEDLEWSKKVLEAGYKIVYEPRAAVIHSHNRSVMYEYGRTYVCHRRLNELFGLRAVPTLMHVIYSALATTVSNILYVWMHETNLRKRFSLMLKTPFLSFSSAYAQYRGARDQMKTKEMKALKGL
jgi:rhamnosyltransferase